MFNKNGTRIYPIVRVSQYQREGPGKSYCLSHNLLES